MSYRISYDAGPVIEKTDIHLSKRRHFFFRLITVLIVCVIGVCILSGHAEIILDYILPGNPEITKKAIRTMTNEIKAGSSLKDAVTTFCREILTDVKY